MDNNTNSSILLSLSYYMPREGHHSEENFLTEALCFLLRYSIRKSTLLFKEFLSLFDMDLDLSEYRHYSVHTQRAYRTTEGKLAYPDIVIINGRGNYLFIEVKVEAGINQYSISEKEILDQIDVYRRIETKRIAKVCLLSKYIYPKHDEDLVAKRWHEVVSMLEKYNTSEQAEGFLVRDIVTYLKEKNMATPRVTYELMRGMESLNNLCQQIEQALESYSTQKSFGYEFLGYYILTKDKKKVAWVGTYYDGERIAISIQGQPRSFAEKLLAKYPKEFEDKDDYGGFWVHCWFNFEEQGYFCLSGERQVEVLGKWLRKKLDLVLEIG